MKIYQLVLACFTTSTLAASPYDPCDYGEVGKGFKIFSNAKFPMMGEDTEWSYSVIKGLDNCQLSPACYNIRTEVKESSEFYAFPNRKSLGEFYVDRFKYGYPIDVDPLRIDAIDGATQHEWLLVHDDDSFSFGSGWRSNVTIEFNWRDPLCAETLKPTEKFQNVIKLDFPPRVNVTTADEWASLDLLMQLVTQTYGSHVVNSFDKGNAFYRINSCGGPDHSSVINISCYRLRKYGLGSVEDGCPADVGDGRASCQYFGEIMDVLTQITDRAVELSNMLTAEHPRPLPGLTLPETLSEFLKTESFGTVRRSVIPMQEILRIFGTPMMLNAATIYEEYHLKYLPCSLKDGTYEPSSFSPELGYTTFECHLA